MAWNEPGNRKNSDGDKDPWGKKPEGGEPPDLEKIFKQFFEKIKKAFSSKGFGSAMGSGQGSSAKPGSIFTRSGFDNFNTKEWKVWGAVIAGGILILYVLAGFYIVEPAERAVVTRFGAYVRTEEPGLHWLPSLIENKEIVNVVEVQTTEHRGLMLTRDENIGSVEIIVQYQIENAENFLFDVVNPINTLKQTAESSLRQVVGQSTLDEVLTSGQIASNVKEQIVSTLKPYNTGILVLDVVLQRAKAPEEVRAAFDDVTKAREEAERSKNQAKTYANEILPKAQANAKRIINEATAYQQEVKLAAEGRVQRFNLILSEYQKAPQVNRTRMYLDMMQSILSNTNKALVDTNSNNILYLPMDKIIPVKKRPDSADDQEKN